MVLAASPRYKRYTPTVLTDTFVVPFPLFGDDDLRIFVDGVETTVFGLSASFQNGRADDGEITLGIAVVGVNVDVYGARDPRRDNQYLPGSPDLALNLQRDIEAVTAVQQEQQRDIQNAQAAQESADRAELAADEATSLVGNLSGMFLAGFTPIDFGASMLEATALERFQFTNQGDSATRVTQDGCEVQSRNAVYTMHVHDNGGDDVCVIEKFNLHGPRSQTAVRWTKVPSGETGHQGITVEHTADGVKFWASVDYTAQADSEHWVCRFEIDDDPLDAENLIVSNVEYFKVWAGSSFGDGSATPCVSPCGNFMVVRARDEDGLRNHIRVFKMSVFGAAGDYSDPANVLFEFTTNFFPDDGTGSSLTNFPVQLLLTDGQFIYLAGGYGDAGATKRFACYSINGDVIAEIANFGVGLTRANEDPGVTYFELEGGWITQHAGRYCIAALVASGEVGARVARVFYLNGNQVLRAVGIGEMPAVATTGKYDFGVTSTEVARFGGYAVQHDGTVVFDERLNLGVDALNDLGPRNEGTFTVTVEESASQGVGAASPTTAVGHWKRGFGRVDFTFTLSGIDVTPLLPGNVYLHGLPLAPAAADSNFTFTPLGDTVLAVRYSGVDLSADHRDLTAVLKAGGYIELQEHRDDNTSVILDAAQVAGADLTISGSFLT